MKIQEFIFVSFFISVCSCDFSVDKPGNAGKDTLKLTLDTVFDPIVHKEEINVDSKGFISIYPSKEWIDSMQAILGEDGWNEVVFDNQHFIHEAQTYLKSKGYVEMEQPEGKLWKIKRPNCIVKTIDSDTLVYKWGTLIFNWHEDPVFYEGTEPDEDLKNF